MLTQLARSSTSRMTHRLLAILVLLSLFYVLYSPVVVEGYAGLGGYITEKLLSRTAGAATASLYLGSGAAGPIVIGRGPSLSTGSVTNAGFSGGTTTATLNGNLTGLAGFPLAQVQFQWGYSAAAMTNTTALTTVTATGAFSATITGYDPTQEIYYRALGYTDGLTYGSIAHFHVSSGGGIGWYILWNILSLIVGLGVFVLTIALARGGNWVAVIIAVLLGLMTIVIIQTLLPTVWN